MLTKGYALVVDDHPLVARGFAEFLQSHCGFDEAHIAANAAACQEWLAAHNVPRLVVVDFWLPDGSALSLLQELSQRYPETRILVVSGDDSGGIQTRVREAGAHAFLRKNEPPESFVQAVSVLLAGDCWFPHSDSVQPDATRRELPIRATDLGLTDRQGQVLAMVLRGLPNKRIALTLAVSEATIKEHVTAILAKLGVATRMEAIALLNGRRLDL